MTLCIALLGLIAGTLTTLTGAGGGLFLLVTLSWLLGPHAALAATAPALLAGNLHRATLYRKLIDRRVALPIIAGALPGSLVGGLAAVALPGGALRVVLIGVIAYAALRATGRGEWRPPRGMLMPAGATVGALAATSGGGGVLAGPLLLSNGLTGRAYVATSAAVALSTHVGRLAAYGMEGSLTREVLAVAAIATVAVVTGNAVGDRARVLLDERQTALLEYATLVVAGFVSLVSLGG